MAINPWLAGAAGGVGAGVGASYLNKDFKNPADSAMPYLDKVPDILKQYFQPYVNAGGNALNKLPGIYDNMLNPNQLLSQIGSGYKQSPGFQWQLGQGLQATNQAAAAGGMLGSPQHQQQSATTAEGLANQDYYNYLGKALGVYGQGAEGYGNLAKMGQESSTNLGEDWAQNLMNQGNLAYAGQANQNSAEGGRDGAILAFLGQLLSGGAKAAGMGAP